MARKGNLAVFEGKRKGAKSSKLERLGQPKLVYMHYTSTPTCIFFEPILLIFYILKPMGYSPWPEREIGRFWKQPKSSKIFETGEARSTKIGIPVLYTHPYLHEFFEPVVS